MSVPLKAAVYLRLGRHVWPRKIATDTLTATSGSDMARQTAALLRTVADEIEASADEQEGNPP